MPLNDDSCSGRAVVKARGAAECRQDVCWHNGLPWAHASERSHQKTRLAQCAPQSLHATSLAHPNALHTPPPPTLTFRTDRRVQVEKRVAKMSELVKTMIPEEEDGETDQQEIPLPNVKSQILGKVMEFCKHYCEEPMNEIEKPLKRFVASYF